ncbi:hypothetical protein JCM21900_002241 [Sporobolomyces salmonicolor]
MPSSPAALSSGEAMPINSARGSPSPDHFALTILSSTSTLNELDTHAGDGDGYADGDGGSSSPLLKPSASGNYAGDAPEPLPKRRRRLTRLVLLAACLAMTMTAVLCWRLPKSRFSLADFAAAVRYSPSAKAHNTSSDPPLSPTQQFLLDPLSSNIGIIPFPSTLYSPLYTPRPLRPTLSTAAFPSSSCIELYVSMGELCGELLGRWADETQQPRVDVIWTWVNGSSQELLSSWRQAVSEEIGQKRWVKRAKRRLSGLARRVLGGEVVKHFRDHDELRFSLRSALSSFSPSQLSTLHLVVGDTPSFPPWFDPYHALFQSNDSVDYYTSTRYAQIPHWLDLPSIEFSEPGLQSFPAAEPRLRVHPHSELFQTAEWIEEESQANATELEGESRRRHAAEWKGTVLPSFNSLAIESQLGNLETEALSALYLNDDNFLMQPLSTSDVESPLSGPIFRVQRDLLVGAVAPDDPDAADPDGEWRGLGISAWLLDQRFGQRRRCYLVHIGKAVSIPMLKEVQGVFLDALTATAEARFRGKAPLEVQPMFLYTMYTIEKQREALLWSFLVARSHLSLTGAYTPSERAALLSTLGYNSSTPSLLYLHVSAPSRDTLGPLLDSYAATGLPLPKETAIEFSSKDGYGFFGLDKEMAGVPQYTEGWPSFDVRQKRIDDEPQQVEDGAEAEEVDEDAGEEEDESGPVCTLDLKTCFGTEFLVVDTGNVSVQDTFRRVAFEKPQCGDCLIALLLGKSGKRGLEAFLPPPSGEGEGEGEEDDSEIEGVGLSGTKWWEVDFVGSLRGKGSLRRRATRLIQRYAYSLGSSRSSFQSIRSGGMWLTLRLNALSSTAGDRKPPAFIALNDDVVLSKFQAANDVDKRMEEWFRRVWPEPTRVEFPCFGCT